MSAYALPGFLPPLPQDGLKSGSFFDESSFNFSFVDTNNEEKTEFVETDKVDVVVRNAKIDALELVNSLSKSGKPKVSRGRLRRRHSWSRSKKTTEQGDEASQFKCAPQEVAMQFEMSITFKGTSYNVVRSLARIRQLRHDLMKELDFEQSKNHCKLDPVLCYSPSKAENSLPLLPEVLNDGATTTNFGLLQAVLQQYTPTLETWLHTIISMVSPKESPSLANFLCEPLLQIHTSVVVARRRGSRGKSAPARLECILEEHLEED